MEYSEASTQATVATQTDSPPRSLATERPWKIVTSPGNPKRIFIQDSDGRGWDVCEISIGKSPDANAAHIVHCVNNFEALLEALKTVRALQYDHSDGVRIAVEEVVQSAIEVAEGR